MTRPLPSLVEPDTAAFWHATAEHRLTYQVCGACARVVFFPRSHCPGCGAPDPQERESAGRGVVYALTVIRVHHDPYFRARLPFVTALIDLDEGFRLLTELIDVDPGTAVPIGTRVVLAWEDHDGVSLPVFRPETPATTG